MSDEEEEVEASFISALDDAEIRQNCFAMALQHRKADDDFTETLTNAMCIYDWVMGEDELSIEEAAEPASVDPEEICEPKPH